MRATYLANAALLMLIAPSAALSGVSCNVAVSTVVFGTYDVFNTVPTDSTGSVDVTCADAGGGGGLTVDVSVTLSPSATSTTNANRQMASGGSSDRLDYNLYRDAAYQFIWGDQPGLDDYIVKKVRVPKNGSVPLPLTIFARIPAGQDVTAGNYSDTVTVTVIP